MPPLRDASRRDPQGPALTDSVPPAPAVRGRVRAFLFQALATCALALGAWYLAWRWTASLNPGALAFSIAVACAETLAYVGAALFFLSIWRLEDPRRDRRRGRSRTSSTSRSSRTAPSASTSSSRR